MVDVSMGGSEHLGFLVMELSFSVRDFLLWEGELMCRVSRIGSELVDSSLLVDVWAGGWMCIGLAGLFMSGS